MVFKLKTGPRILYTYRCELCGEETEYIVDFGPSQKHGRKFGGNGRAAAGVKSG